MANTEAKVPQEKHPGGRPALYKTPEEIQDKIDEYFRRIEEEQKTNSDRIPGVAELAYYLGFASRQSMYDQEKRGDEFSYAVKRARLYIEAELEKKLSGEKSNPTKWIYFLNSRQYQRDESKSNTRRIGGNVIIITTDKKPEGLNIDGQEILPDED